MKPGVELDALLAEALGWTRLRRVESPVTTEVRLFGVPAGREHEEHVPRWSTTWSAAGELLEATNERCSIYRALAVRHRWEAVVGVRGAVGMTGPHAISLAALEALRSGKAS